MRFNRLDMAVAAAVVPLFALPAGATDYYVSSHHPSRSDANPGTSPDAPWATTDAVRDRWDGLNAGDTVYLERGSVFEVDTSSGNDGSTYLKLQTGGTPGNPLTLTGLGYGTGSKPVIRRTAGSNPDTFISIRDNYVVVRDIELDGNMSAGFATSGVVIWTDSPGDGDNGAIHHVQILNMDLHDLGGESSGSSRYICGIVMNGMHDYPISDCLIEGNTISDYSAHGLNDYAGYFTNNVWRNNVVINDYPHRDETVNSALQVGTGFDNVFEHNYLHDSTLTTDGAAIRIAGKGNDSGLNTIRFNVVADSGNHGIHFVISNETGPWVMRYDVYGNVVYQSARAGLSIDPFNDWVDSTVHVFNNTFFDNWTAGGSDQDGEVTIGWGCDNVTINLSNNLIHHAGSGDTVALAINDPMAGGVLNHGNNLFFHTGGASAVVVNDQGATFSLAAVTSFEDTAQSADPLFADPQALPTAASHTEGTSPKGLALQSGSPAIGTGADLGSTYGLDIDGHERTVPWTIGAYQAASDADRPAAPTNLRVVPAP